MSGGSELGNVRMASSAPAPSSGDEPSLLMSIFRRRKRFVLVATAVAVLTTLAATASQTKTYSATSTAAVNAPPGQIGANGPNMATEAQIARSTAVASAVAHRLRLDVPPSELLTRLGVFVPADSDIVKFTYSSPRPEDAQAGAQAFAKAYADVRRRQFEDTTLLAASSTAKRINEMSDRLSAVNLELEHAVGNRKRALGIQSGSLTTELSTLQQTLADLNGQAASFTPAVVGRGDSSSDLAVEAQRAAERVPWPPRRAHDRIRDRGTRGVPGRSCPKRDRPPKAVGSFCPRSDPEGRPQRAGRRADVGGAARAYVAIWRRVPSAQYELRCSSHSGASEIDRDHERRSKGFPGRAHHEFGGPPRRIWQAGGARNHGAASAGARGGTRSGAWSWTSRCTRRKRSNPTGARRHPGREPVAVPTWPARSHRDRRRSW